jgi:hypothetical protein
MKLTAKQAALLSDRERSMLASKGPWQIKQLVSLIKRSRELRDKYRHQAQRQSIAAANRTLQKPDAANARTLQKADIFDNALKQFEAELAKISSECTAAMRELKVGKNPVRQKTLVKKAPAKKTSKAKK